MIFAASLAIPGLLFALLAWIGYRAMPRARLFCLAIALGVGYWYLLPGTLFLLGGEVAAADIALLGAHREIVIAILLVHASLAMLLLLAIFSGASSSHRAVLPDVPVESGRLDLLLMATVVSTVTFLAYRYAEMGPAFALQLLIGLTSAREVMSFENFSAGPTQSLLALWDIVNIFLSIFLAATFTWQRQLLSVRFVGAGATTILAFVSSGSRTVVLLLLFGVAMALICRPRAAVSRKAGPNRFTGRGALPLLLMAGLVAITAVAMLARFQDDPSQSESLALNSVGSHNDMFRELVFVLRNGWAYRSDPLLFLQTPITFAMPTFLGFNKSIAPHLIDFNMDRAGIDLILGLGNVFPGLIGDMVLCFGLFAPVALCLFSALMFATCLAAAGRGTNTSVNSGLLVTLLCYYIISFRNLQGAFGILLVLSAAVSTLLSQPRTRPLANNAGSSPASCPASGGTAG